MKNHLLEQRNAEQELTMLLVKLTLYQKDLLIACPRKGCGAKRGRACRGTARGVVHFGRRLKRLLAGIR